MFLRALISCGLCFATLSPCLADGTLDAIGVTALRNQDSSLTGSGVTVMQVESAPNPAQFEVNPASVGQPVKLFTYQSTAGHAVTYPNSVGSESGHANQVGQNFYGSGSGVAPGVQRVAIKQTKYFTQPLKATTARIINQSFEFGGHDDAEDQRYDNYIALHHAVVVSGIGDGGAILTPSDCYNGIGVGANGGASSNGPTADGRCKPDLVAPSGATSFSTPLVSGAAAVLIQAGRRLGAQAAAATDCRTVKALLMNGAAKPSGWTHSATVPLDPNYGAGVLNVFTSFNELRGGKHAPSQTTTPTLAQAHPPATASALIGASRGWDLRGLGSSAGRNGVSHYRIQGSGNFAATLVWFRDYGRSRINRLALYLYNSSGSLVSSSESTVDNVQHLYLTGLSSDTYDLEVVKLGGASAITSREGYAVVWDFAP